MRAISELTGKEYELEDVIWYGNALQAAQYKRRPLSARPCVMRLRRPRKTQAEPKLPARTGTTQPKTPEICAAIPLKIRRE